MKFQSILLEQIACFMEKEFHFKNLTVIHGENRTGKSTLVYALYFALFGKHLNTGLNPKDLCRKGEHAGVATLCYAREETKYKLCRSTERMPSLYTHVDPNWQSVYTREDYLASF